MKIEGLSLFRLLYLNIEPYSLGLNKNLTYNVVVCFYLKILRICDDNCITFVFFRRFYFPDLTRFWNSVLVGGNCFIWVSQGKEMIQCDSQTSLAAFHKSYVVFFCMCSLYDHISF